jgi:hypothetical protein
VGRLSEPRYGVAVFTATASLLLSAHWLPMAIPTIIVLAIVVAAPTVGLRPYLWGGLAAGWLAVFVALPQHMEDHVYLFAVWLVALALSLRHGEESTFLDSLAWQARILIGATFTAAVLWKVLLGDFVNGMTLWVFFVIDKRFELVASSLGISEATLRSQRDAVGALLDQPGNTDLLEAPDHLLWRVMIVAILTLVLEGVVAVSYLAPDGHFLATLRLPAIVLFAVATYAVVPVVGFAFLLALMAMSAGRWRREILLILPVMVLPAVIRLATFL